jgi:hypothetical protein
MYTLCMHYCDEHVLIYYTIIFRHLAILINTIVYRMELGIFASTSVCEHEDSECINMNDIKVFTVIGR